MISRSETWHAMLGVNLSRRIKHAKEAKRGTEIIIELKPFYAADMQNGNLRSTVTFIFP